MIKLMNDKILKIEPAVMRATLNHPEANNFLNFLKTKIEKQKILKAVNSYNIGTSAKWPGATIFWQVDINDNINTGKIAQYNLYSGEITDTPFVHTGWIHNEYKQFGYKANECLYGEHLLAGNNYTVGLVETEKSAIVASIFKPELVWVSVGKSSNLTPEFCKNLKGKKVVVYPDTDVYDSWCKKVEFINKYTPMSVDPLLQKDAVFRNLYKRGTMADYLFLNHPNSDG
jgi:hypothetical protein